jgi:hypothetical protein
MPSSRERMTASFPGKIRHLPGGGEGTGIKRGTWCTVGMNL